MTLRSYHIKNSLKGKKKNVGRHIKILPASLCRNFSSRGVTSTMNFMHNLMFLATEVSASLQDCASLGWLLWIIIKRRCNEFWETKEFSKHCLRGAAPFRIENLGKIFLHSACILSCILFKSFLCYDIFFLKCYMVVFRSATSKLLQQRVFIFSWNCLFCLLFNEWARNFKWWLKMMAIESALQVIRTYLGKCDGVPHDRLYPGHCT